MHPQLLPFLPVPSYGAMLVLAWGVGWWLTRRRARRLGIPTWSVDWLIPLLLVSAGLGSRLAGFLCQILSDESANDRILYGGLFLAVVVGVAYGWIMRVPIGRLADSFSFSLPVSICLLRIGCFLAGCCWGDVCVDPARLARVEDETWRRQVQTIPAVCDEDWPLCVRFPEASPAYYQHLSAGLLDPSANRSLRVHPVQLYEATAMLALLVFLLSIDGHLRWWGESFLLFCLGYSVVRLVVEWFRADNALVLWNLTMSQLASIVCAVACLAIWWWRRIVWHRSPRGEATQSGTAACRGERC